MFYDYDEEGKVYNRFKLIADAAISSGEVDYMKTYMLESFDRWDGVDDYGLFIKFKNGLSMGFINEEIPTVNYPYDAEDYKENDYISSEEIAEDSKYEIYFYNKDKDFESEEKILFVNFETEIGSHIETLGIKGSIALMKDIMSLDTSAENFKETLRFKPTSTYELIDNPDRVEYSYVDIKKDNEDDRDYGKFQPIIDCVRDLEEVSEINIQSQEQYGKTTILKANIILENDFNIEVHTGGEENYFIMVRNPLDGKFICGKDEEGNMEEIAIKCTKEEIASIIDKLSYLDKNEELSFEELKGFKPDNSLEF